MAWPLMDGFMVWPVLPTCDSLLYIAFPQEQKPAIGTTGLLLCANALVTLLQDAKSACMEEPASAMAVCQPA